MLVLIGLKQNINIIPINNTKISIELAIKLFKTKYCLDSFQIINRFNVNLKKFLNLGKLFQYICNTE